MRGRDDGAQYPRHMEVDGTAYGAKDVADKDNLFTKFEQ